MQQFSLLGIVKHIIMIDQRYFYRASKAEGDFRTTSIREAIFVPGLKRFPVPVQIKLGHEVRDGQRLCEEGEIPTHAVIVYEGDPVFEGQWQAASCVCRF